MTPVASVDAVQLKLIWLMEAAVAVRLDGLVGGVVSPGVVALARLE